MFKIFLVLLLIGFTGFQNLRAQDVPSPKDSVPALLTKKQNDAIDKQRETDSLLNVEYRTRRDAMNNKGTKGDTGMQSTFRMNKEGVNPDSAMNHVPKLNGDLNMNHEPAKSGDLIFNRVPRMYDEVVLPDTKKKNSKMLKVDSAKTKHVPRSALKNPSTPQTANLNNIVHEGFTMLKGKMMEMKEKGLTPMNFNITLVNGTYVSHDGIITKKNGTKVKFKDGDFIDFYGRMNK